MAQKLSPGDFLVFQLESGFGLLRVIAIDGFGPEAVWHVAGYDEFFLEVDDAEKALSHHQLPTPSHGHIALTNRAFESTQVSKLENFPLSDEDLKAFWAWKADPHHEVSDRSVRLMMGLR